MNRYHAVDNFDCGIELLNEYLKRFAYINNQNNSSRTYVACKGQRVIGYYTIAPGSAGIEVVPSRVAKGLARHPVPLFILARLAVDKNEQNNRIGSSLLRDALIRIVSAAKSIGGRAILVHAKNDTAKAFYKKFGFEESPVDVCHLFLLLKDIEKTLGIRKIK